MKNIFAICKTLQGQLTQNVLKKTTLCCQKTKLKRLIHKVIETFKTTESLNLLKHNFAFLNLKIFVGFDKLLITFSGIILQGTENLSEY